MNNDIDMILRYCIDNSSVTPSLGFLDDILEHEDYIIFFYIKIMASKGVNLSRLGLINLMSAHKESWLDKNSIYSKKYNNGVKTVPREYIQYKSNKDLSQADQYSTELFNLVLNRFDEIMKIENYSESDVESSLESFKISVQDKYVHQLIDDVLPLLTGEQSDAIINNRRYSRMYLLNYIRDRIDIMLGKVQSATITRTTTDISNKLLNDISRESSSGDPVFHWNISRPGQPILKNPQPGWIITLNAPPKVGKTKFVVGECVYNTLVEGKNVKYYSGEMGKSEILASICIKHIYASQGLKLDFEMACNVIKIVQKLRLKTYRTNSDRDKDVALLQSYNRTRVELVLSAQNEILQSGKFGCLTIVHAGDDLGSSESSDSKQFICEDYINNNIAELESLPENLRYDLIVVDHANHFKSRTGKSLYEKLEDVYQGSKTLANNKIHALTVIIINHTNTNETKAVRKISNAEDLKDMTFDAYGSSSDRKDADLALTLIQTAEQEREGTLTLIVNDDRRQSHQQIYGTNQFILTADKSVNDFCVIGTQKSAYLTKEQIEKAIQSALKEA